MLAVVDHDIIPRHADFGIDATSLHIFKPVSEFFNSDEKAKLWFKTPNPHFGDISPLALIALGRAHKVEAFIKQALNANSK